MLGLLRRFGRAIRRGWAEPEFRGLLYLVSIVVVAGTVFYRAAESWSWVDSLYFSVVTVTTVGFGDISPTTDGSKLFTIAYILVGVGLITAFFNARLKTKAAYRFANKDQSA